MNHSFQDSVALRRGFRLVGGIGRPGWTKGRTACRCATLKRHFQSRPLVSGVPRVGSGDF